MKQFDIITETDARVLSRGETVMLARGGHVTPLAHDTLKERRRYGRARRDGVGRRGLARAAGRHPIGRDRQRSHRRRHCGRRCVTFLRGRGLAVQDLGTDGRRSRSTIPMWRRRLRMAVARGEADAGIVIDGAGIGSAIAANKIAASGR